MSAIHSRPSKLRDFEDFERELVGAERQAAIDAHIAWLEAGKPDVVERDTMDSPIGQFLLVTRGRQLERNRTLRKRMQGCGYNEQQRRRAARG